MVKYKYSLEKFSILTYLIRWTILVIPVSIVTGSLVALFLWLLNWAIDFRFAHPWLLFLLPVAGVFIYLLYRFTGKNSEAGTNLIMDEIHQPGGGVPLRMAPLVLASTIITHLFGGSAGREGTAVQMGGSIAHFFADKLKFSADDRRILLMTGMAGGFGAVFGTPVTGAIFAMEVIALGSIKYDALLPCLMAALFSDFICSSWGIHHVQYHIDIISDIKSDFYFFHFDFRLVIVVIIAGILFGLTAYLFSSLGHWMKDFFSRIIKIKWLIPFVGGCIIITLTFILGTQDYLSLGVSNPNINSVSILSCFRAGGATDFSWLWKLLFTTITLSTGFKGGEVTPLFFIGAALGNTIAVLTGVPVDLLAALGFIAVFSGATNTPIACTMMGIELFGGQNTVYFAIACFTAYYFSGHSGIYNSQRVGVAKISVFNHLNDSTIREIFNEDQKKEKN